ncbi:MAG: hypothetical protein O8C60_02160, partial [Candidatus Methanoperedens sp.]|nr:hypothetical protein [Candidatus Methanoperedens sp.]
LLPNLILMSQFYNILTEMLSKKQMSISSIARELKKSGYDHHRLILTGYLRALHDTGYLEVVDIPPSIVYTFKADKKRDIYTILKEYLKEIDVSERLEIAVFILSSLFHRPCFRYELGLLGIEPQRTKTVKESKDSRLKEHRAAVTRIKIPNDDPAFEISGETGNVSVKGNEILIEIINELMDLEGLKAKYQQTKIA